MIYIPWIVFGLAVVWIILQGYKAKREYKRREENSQKNNRDEVSADARSAVHVSSQGQEAELTGALVGQNGKQIRGFGQQGTR